jgi:hypothetical protein
MKTATSKSRWQREYFIMTTIAVAVEDLGEFPKLKITIEAGSTYLFFTPSLISMPK